MYIFSITAKSQHEIEGFDKDASAPFIVYIDYKDLFGAEFLAKLFLAKEGFYEPVIEKRKQLSDENVQSMKQHDKQISDAVDTGYAIQLFDEH